MAATATATSKLPEGLLDKFVEQAVAKDVVNTFLETGNPYSEDFSKLVKKMEDRKMLKPGLVPALLEAAPPPAAAPAANPVSKEGSKVTAASATAPAAPAAAGQDDDGPAPTGKDGTYSLADVKASVGDEEFEAVFESDQDARVAHQALKKIGFTSDVDERLGGTLKKSRKGYVMTVKMKSKRTGWWNARRKAAGPVLQFVKAVQARYAEHINGLLDKVVAEVSSA